LGNHIPFGQKLLKRKEILDYAWRELECKKLIFLKMENNQTQLQIQIISKRKQAKNSEISEFFKISKKRGSVT